MTAESNFRSHLHGDRTVFWVAYALLLVLYASVGLVSPGYDDEFFNIFAIERLGAEVLAYTQSGDVHPPASYLLNWIFFSALKDWSLVRLANSIFAAGCIIYAIESVRTNTGRSSGVMALVLIGLNPALLLWCTGIRWYAYFVPIFLWLCITPKQATGWYWAKLFIGLIVLAYIGYAAFFVAPALIALYWRDCKMSSRDKLWYITVFGGVAAAVYSHQLLIFLTVHIKSTDSQVSTVVRSVIGFAIAQIGNQGVFPVSVGGVASAIGTSGLLVLSMVQLIKSPSEQDYVVPYWLGVAAFILSGLAAKFRNFVVLSPLQGLMFSSLNLQKSNKTLIYLFVVFVAVGNVVGIHNVMVHRDTTKNSWNMPVVEVLENLEATRSACGADMVVLSHDPLLTYWAESEGYAVISPYARQFSNAYLEATDLACVVALKTFQGSIDNKTLQDMYAFLDHADSKTVDVVEMNRDVSYAWKKRLDPRYPEFQVEMWILKAVAEMSGAAPWAPKNPLPQEIR